MSCCINEAATLPLDSLLRHVAVNIPQLPYVVALDLVRERYRELCRRSGLVVAYTELPIQRDVTNYFLTAPDEYEVFAIKAAGHPTGWAWTHADAHHWFGMWGHRFWVKDNSEIVFDRAPSCDESDRFVLMTVIPSDCCASIPVSVSSPYGRAIAAGAVADALCIPNKPWTNHDLSKRYEVAFNRGVLAAKNLAITNRGAITPEFKPIRIL